MQFTIFCQYTISYFRKNQKYISNIINKNIELLEVYFKSESPLDFSIDGNLDILGYSNKKELIKFIRKLSSHQIKYKAIKSMGEFRNDAAKEMIKNRCFFSLYNVTNEDDNCKNAKH